MPLVPSQAEFDALAARVAALEGAQPAPEPEPSPEPRPEPEPVPEPVPEPTAGWPASWQELPTVPPAGWLTGTGYPEPRRFVEAQGHFSTAKNLDAHAGIIHTHVGVAAPVCWAGIVALDFRVLALHAEGAIFDGVTGAMLRGVEGYKRLIPEPRKAGKPGLYQRTIDAHLWSLHVPIWFDVTGVPDGWCYFEGDVDFVYSKWNGTIYPRQEKTRLQFAVYINNQGTWTPDQPHPWVQAEWITNIPTLDEAGARIGEVSLSGGYPGVRIVNPKPFASSSDQSLSVLTNPGGGQRALATEVRLNPDLHADPPNLGLELLPEEPATAEKVAVPFTAGNVVAGDRIVARASDTAGPEAHLAVLAVATVGEG